MSVVIPENISIIGVYTSSFVLLVSYISFLYNDKILGCLMILLYIFSTLNWKKYMHLVGLNYLI